MMSLSDLTWTDAMSSNNDRSKTAPLSADPEQLRQALPPRAALLIHHRDGNTVVTLMPAESVVLGRSRPADVVVSDPTASSRHARFEFDGEHVTITDLGSTNGTFVNDARLAADASARLEAGDDLRCGSTVIVVMLLSRGERRPRGLDSHERVAAALGEELERARHFGRDVSLLHVAARADGEHIGRFAPEVQAKLRAIDRAALLTPAVLEVLLAERTAAEAEEVARSIVASCPQLAVGVASYPELCPGRPDAMRDAARAALLVAKESGGVSLAEKAHVSVVQDSAAPVIASAAMKRLFDNVSRFARSSMPVLIRGETGSGKEVVARALHESGPRRGKPMLAVNCGALPPSLVESVLFGTEKGVATNVDARPGLFESANGGTLFLDEIGELSPEAQAALLRVLESKVVTRLGSPHKEIRVDVRVIAATHKDLEEMAADGKFRSDLRFRLEGERFDVPPLRKRTEEIVPLARRFLERTEDSGHIEGFDERALAALVAYHWPGNVRELKNAVERAVVVCPGPLIGVDDLPEKVRLATATPARTGVHRLDDVPLVNSAHTAHERGAPAPAGTLDDEQEADLLGGGANGGGPGGGGSGEGRGEGADYRARMRELEAMVLIDALGRNGGVQVAAARDLKMPVRTFVHKLKALGIKRDQGRYVLASEGDERDG
jgi:two-component system, NtrC family, response regulator AtoC